MGKILHAHIKNKQIEHLHPLSPRDLFCRVCGEGVATMGSALDPLCAVCRMKVNEGDKFCWNCGDSLQTLEAIIYTHEGKQTSKDEFEAKLLKFKGKVKGDKIG